MSKLSKASEFTVDDEGSTTLEQDSEEHIRLADVGQASLLGLVVFLSRYLTKGPVYYVDGPILVRCILDRTYVIQPPGYWLFARLGGLFGDPAFGLQFLNETFSALGAVVFFLLCRKLGLGKGMAWVASVCYEFSSSGSRATFIVRMPPRFSFRLFWCCCFYSTGNARLPLGSLHVAPALPLEPDFGLQTEASLFSCSQFLS